MTVAEAEATLGRIVREALDEKVGPTLDAFREIRDAADTTDDDAELGRQVRTIVRKWGERRVASPE